MYKFLCTCPRTNTMCNISSFLNFLKVLIFRVDNTGKLYYILHKYLLFLMCYPCYLSIWNTDLQTYQLLPKTFRVSLRSFIKVLISSILLIIFILKNIPNPYLPLIFQATVLVRFCLFSFQFLSHLSPSLPLESAVALLQNELFCRIILDSWLKRNLKASQSQALIQETPKVAFLTRLSGKSFPGGLSLTVQEALG